MSETITIPAGTRVKNLATGRTEVLQEAVRVKAQHRIADDTWVWATGLALYEVKLTPGD